MWKEFLKTPVRHASIQLDSLTEKKIVFWMGCWRLSPAWPRAGHLVLCKVPRLPWFLPLLREVDNVGYSENNWLNMYFKSPYVKIRIIRGLPGRTAMRMTWIETRVRHWCWGRCTDGVHECSVKQKSRWQSQAAPEAVQLKPRLHWIWSCLSFRVLLYRIFKSNVITWAFRIRVFCIIQWKPS